MPGVENWAEKPLNIIQNIIDHLPSGSNEISGVKDYFSKKLQGEEALEWIPSINSRALHQVAADSVVRYRCMVQDMFDPELYLARFKVTSRKNGESAFRSGRYRDVASCAPDEEIHMDDPGNVTCERQTLYCVPVPGEATWVKDLYTKQSRIPSTPSTSSSPACRKRARDDETGDGDVHRGSNGSECAASNGHAGPRGGAAGTGGNPAPSGIAGGGGGASQLPDLNFPLPGEQGTACLVKVYEEDNGLKVNDVIEVVGILSVDPSMADFTNDQNEQDVTMTAAERAAHTPPPSLVPRLHAVLIRKLAHNNPLLPHNLSAKHQAIETIRSEAATLRTQLLSVLEHALCGDGLAAEFLLCHLVSNVYSWADVMPLGKLAVNLSGPVTQGMAPLLQQLIAGLSTQSHLLPISLNKMNSLCLSPHKDYEANRLRSGQLQLSPGTHLVLDETALENGQLQPQGVKNVTALGNVIQWQKVTYDFNFHTQDFITDLPVLVLSEGESFLPKDLHLPLRPTSVPEDLQTHYAGMSAQMTEEVLNKLRAFITVCRSTQYAVNEDIQKALQEEFVTARKDDPSAMSVNDFHRLLSLVRLLTLSHCQAECTPQILNRVLEMERERRSRTHAPPAAPAN
ncbi:mini-chromosome maintenance complex-binding protein-like [Littorina saxatilis]|uniref:Mini-chromosome maintenance complex-binding protein n=1 Tax=Littorina saxatilis TaxID=31220 RepID=A0AAN9GIL0_9CAEN